MKQIPGLVLLMLVSLAAYGASSPCLQLGITVVSKLPNGEYEIKYSAFGGRWTPAILKSKRAFTAAGPVAGTVKLKRIARRSVNGVNGFPRKLDILEDCKNEEPAFP